MGDILEPDRYRAVAAAVLEKALRDLTSSQRKDRRLARAFWLYPNNPLRSFWADAAGMDEDAMVEKLHQRGLLESDEGDG